MDDGESAYFNTCKKIFLLHAGTIPKDDVLRAKAKIDFENMPPIFKEKPVVGKSKVGRPAFFRPSVYSLNTKAPLYTTEVENTVPDHVDVAAEINKQQLRFASWFVVMGKEMLKLFRAFVQLSDALIKARAEVVIKLTRNTKQQMQRRAQKQEEESEESESEEDPRPPKKVVSHQPFSQPFSEPFSQPFSQPFFEPFSQPFSEPYATPIVLERPVLFERPPMPVYFSRPIEMEVPIPRPARLTAPNSPKKKKDVTHTELE